MIVFWLSRAPLSFTGNPLSNPHFVIYFIPGSRMCFGLNTVWLILVTGIHLYRLCGQRRYTVLLMASTLRSRVALFCFLRLCINCLCYKPYRFCSWLVPVMWRRCPSRLLILAFHGLLFRNPLRVLIISLSSSLITLLFVLQSRKIVNMGLSILFVFVRGFLDKFEPSFCHFALGATSPRLPVLTVII